MSTNIRVRFAPSPTGYLHIGGLRTALYNYLFAKRNGGVFILRIEDTDRSRYVEGAVENLISTLKWAGLDYDEGPGKDGGYGPYVQSERLDIYHKHVAELLDQGKAYYCFCAPERLEEMRMVQQKRGVPPKYDRKCLNLTREEIQENLRKQIRTVVRMKIPDNLTVVVNDVIRRRVDFKSELLDDQVLLKSDGYPTYHLANVIDDHLMKVTHVIRGEEWLSSTPKHVLLYEFFNWELPTFAHLPLLLNLDKSKLSKRQGDVAVEDYRAKGYLAEALINFVALLGWGPMDDQDIFSMEQLIKGFSLERVGKSGSVFNIEKLKWLNEQHIRLKPQNEVANLLKPILQRDGYPVPEDRYLCRVVNLMKERVTVLDDFVTFSPYFFVDPKAYEEGYVKKNWKRDTASHLKELSVRLSRLLEWTAESVESPVREAASELKVDAGRLIHPLRLALTGISIGPGLFELMEVLGKETVLRRITKAIYVLR